MGYLLQPENKAQKNSDVKINKKEKERQKPSKLYLRCDKNKKTVQILGWCRKAKERSSGLE